MHQVIIDMKEYQEYMRLKEQPKISMLKHEKRLIEDHMNMSGTTKLHVRVNGEDVFNLLKSIGAIPQETDVLYYD